MDYGNRGGIKVAVVTTLVAMIVTVVVMTTMILGSG